MAAPAEDGGGPGRGMVVPLVIAVALIVLAFGGAAYGARRTEHGIKVAASATTTSAPAPPADNPATDPAASVPGPPKATPVKAGAALTGDTPCPKPDGSSPRTDTFAMEPPATCTDPAKTYAAALSTTAGRIVIALDGSKKAVNSFVVLARYHYYDGSALFQTIPQIDVVVGGAPKTQSGSDPGPGYTVSDPQPDATVDPQTNQPRGTITYTEGVVGLAPTGQPFAGSGQFFLAAGKNVSQLDKEGVYLVLGHITSGLDVAKKVLLTHTPCNPTDPECASGGPDPVVTVTSVTIQES